MGDKVKVIGRRTGLSSAFALRPFTLERLIFFTSPRQVLISVIRYAGYQVLALLFRFFDSSSKSLCGCNCIVKGFETTHDTNTFM